MSADDRLRVHPHDRLAGAVQHIDLNAEAARLRAEPHAAKDGHRQVALARHGPLAILLFVFERDGLLKSHRADGEVIIHVISGELEVTVEAGPTVLRGGQFLALASGEAHAVRAVQASEMLLTVCHRDRE